MGGVGHIADQLAGLVAALDHGHQNGLRACIKYLFDHIALAHRQADNGMGIGAGQYLQLRQNRAQVIRPVFSVHHKPVETSLPHQLGREGISQPQPAAELHFTPCEGFLERVQGCGHLQIPFWRYRRTLALYVPL